MRVEIVLAVWSGIFFWNEDCLAQSYGIPQRVPNLELRITGLPGQGEYPVPEKLSDMPTLLVAGNGQGHTVDGVIPFEPSAKLWSDGAFKDRYIALPDYAFPAPHYAQMTYRPAGGWDFPEDTVLVKNFLLPLDLRDPAKSLKRIETRILYKKEGDWHGFTFEWNEQETDAGLLASPGKSRYFTIIDTDGRPFSYAWVYPSRSDCLACHTSAANRILGVNTPQMNHDFTYPASGVTDNQLRTFEHLDLFDTALPAPPDTLPRMPDSNDMSVNLEKRARAYLAANCGICHRPGTALGPLINLTWEADTRDLGAIGEKPLFGTPLRDLTGSRIIFPGRPETSVLLARMQTLDRIFRMPRLGSRRVDRDAVALIRDWITSLGTPIPEGLVAEVESASVFLTWSAVSSASVVIEGYNIYRSRVEEELGVQLNQAPLREVFYIDNMVEDGTYYYSVTALGEWQESTLSNQVAVKVTKNAVLFLRGNCNGDSALDISDAIFLLAFLFLGGESPPCKDACNASSDGIVDLADSIYILAFLFAGGLPPGLFPECEILKDGSIEAVCPSLDSVPTCGSQGNIQG